MRWTAEGRVRISSLPRGRLLVLGAMGFFILMTEGAMGDWTAIYLRMDLGAGAGLAGAGFAVFSAAMAVGRLTGDRLVAAFGPVAMVGWGALLAALGLGGALLLHDPLAAILGFGLVGLGLANIVPILFSAAGRTPGMAPGAAIAAVTTAGYSGFLAGPPAGGVRCGMDRTAGERWGSWRLPWDRWRYGQDCWIVERRDIGENQPQVFRRPSSLSNRVFQLFASFRMDDHRSASLGGFGET